MNKPAMHAIRKQAQAGFTLIELIVVIVILGILAATALPKFASLGGDARIATLNAAKGAISSTAATAHGQYLLKPQPSVTYEGVSIAFPVSPATVIHGYPTATTLFFTASGLTSTDYTIIAPSTAATANSPVTTATEIAAIPNSIAGTPKGLTCFVKYTEPTAVDSPPTIVVTSGGC